MATPTDDLSAWNADILRLTLFIDPDFAVKLDDADSWWKRVAQDDPETKLRRPKLAELVDSGPFCDGMLVLQITEQGRRIDWYFSDQPIAITNSGTKSFNARVDAIRIVAARWLAASKAVSRIAFGASAYLPMPDQTSTYQTLSQFIGFRLDIDPARTSDFRYHINRHRESKVIPGVFINRVNKWTANYKVTARLEPSISGQLIQTDVPGELPPEFSVGVELDINNGPTSKTLQRDRLDDFFNELVDLGREILRDGDVP